MEIQITEARMRVNLKIMYALCYLCLDGSVVTSWSLSKKVAVSNNPFEH